MQDYTVPREVADICPAPEKVQEAVSISRSVKKLSNIICIALISMQAVAFIVQFAILAVFLLYKNLFVNISFSYIVNVFQNQQSLMNEISSTVTYFAYMFIPFTLIVFVLRQHPFHIVPVKAVRDKRIIVPAIVLALCFSFISDLATNYIQTFLGFLHLNSTSPDFTAPSGPFSFAVFFFQICILAPICEEFIFRGVILHNLKRFGNAFAVVVSAVLFSMVHGNLLQMPLAFIVGLLFGVIAIKTGSIWITILLHSIVNTESTIINLIATKSLNLANFIYLGVAVLSVAATISVLAYYFSKHPFHEVVEFFRKAVLPNRFLLKKFTTTPAFIVFLIMTVVIVALYTTVI